MEIPKFGISRLVFFSHHNTMILTDVQYDPPAKFRPKPPISERAVHASVHASRPEGVDWAVFGHF